MSEAQDFNELIRVTVAAGTGFGSKQDPHVVGVQGRGLTMELARFVTVFRYEDLPG